MVFENELRRLIREEVARGVRDAVQGQQNAAPPAAEELISVNSAAALGGYSTATIRKWLNEGKLKRYGQGRCSRVSRADFLSFLRRMAMPTKSAEPTDADIDDRAVTLLKGR